jgi:isopentenyl-diphosphate Delta-isomerase
MEEQQVILVNANDEPQGVMDKMGVHRLGLLHRAFSVFIFTSKGEMMLQQRALDKYHSPGLWSNACCSHPQPGEGTLQAAQRRLREELGFECPLKKLFHFVYKADFDNGLTEHEFDHVFVGQYDGTVHFNANEVKDICYKDLKSIKQSLETHPQKYTVWFHTAFPRIESWWKEQYVSRNPANGGGEK